MIPQEEDNLRTLTQSAVVANTKRPLAGLNTRTHYVPMETVKYGVLTPQHRAEMDTIAELYDGNEILNKIYSAFKLLGFDKCGQEATFEEQAMLTLIEQYVKFRQGEIWQDIKREFDVTGLKPTEEDK